MLPIGGAFAPAPCQGPALASRGFTLARISSSSPYPFPLALRAVALSPVPACTTCRALARRTGNGASKARFAGEMHAKPVTALRYERNRARALRDERGLPVRRDIPLRFEQGAPHAGPERSTPCTGPAKRAGNRTGPAE